MSTRIQRRGGTTAEHSTFTGANRELTIDTTKHTAVVHDGSTVGGHPLAKSSELTTGLAGKANTSHTHSIANVTDLQTSLNAKLALDGSNIGEGAGTLLTALGFSGFVQTVLDDSDAATVRGTLGLSYASQTEMEAASSTSKVVSPGVQHHHPSAAKGWVTFSGVTAASILTSYNVSSVTRTTAGGYQVAWDTDFSTANYCCNATSFQPETNIGTMEVGTTNVDTRNSSGTLADAGRVCVMAFGDH
jgi:hypothetical protein